MEQSAVVRTEAGLLDRALDAIAARTAPLYVGLAGLYVAFRAGGFSNVPIWMTDTPSYEQTAAHPVWSLDFLAGTRPFTIPLFYKLFESQDARIVAQVVVSTACWLVLAVAVARAVRHPAVRITAFAAVLGFALVREVTLWDTHLISESLSYSLAALALAAWLGVIRHPTPARAGLLLAALLLWTFTRDSNAWVVFSAAALVAATLVDARQRRLKLALVAGCLAVAVAGLVSAERGERWLLPVKDVVFRRVIETPELHRYFAEHGLSTDGNWTVEPWLEQARGVYAGYLVRHPGYTLTAPFHGRQEALYSTPDNRTSLFSPDLALYNTNEGLGFMRPPSELRRVFFPRDLTLLLALGVGIAALAAAVAIRAGPEPAWLVPAGLLATTYPHLLVAWHFSGYEVDRHALGAAVLLRLGLLVLLLFALDRGLRAALARLAT